jgi:hypothetical protein
MHSYPSDQIAHRAPEECLYWFTHRIRALETSKTAYNSSDSPPIPFLVPVEVPARPAAFLCGGPRTICSPSVPRSPLPSDAPFSGAAGIAQRWASGGQSSYSCRRLDQPTCSKQAHRCSATPLTISVSNRGYMSLSHHTSEPTQRSLFLLERKQPAPETLVQAHKTLPTIFEISDEVMRYVPTFHLENQYERISLEDFVNEGIMLWRDQVCVSSCRRDPIARRNSKPVIPSEGHIEVDHFSSIDCP